MWPKKAFSHQSVSSCVCFDWKNPQSGRVFRCIREISEGSFGTKSAIKIMWRRRLDSIAPHHRHPSPIIASLLPPMGSQIGSGEGRIDTTRYYWFDFGFCQSAFGRRRSLFTGVILISYSSVELKKKRKKEKREKDQIFDFVLIRSWRLILSVCWLIVLEVLSRTNQIIDTRAVFNEEERTGI